MVATRFNRMAERMNRMWSMESWEEGANDLYGAWTPTVISTTRTPRSSQAELPGMRKDDIESRIENNVLMLSGKRQRETEGDEDGYYRSERVYGSFGRSFPTALHGHGRQDRGLYKDGVLTVKLPKTKEAKPEQTPVKWSLSPGNVDRGRCP